MFTQATYTQDRLRHVYHMNIMSFRLTADFQTDLSLAVFLEWFSVCTSETSAPSDCSSLEFPSHLGHTLTEAWLTIITSPSSRSTQPSWLKFTSLISCSVVYTHPFPGSALTFWTSRPRSPSFRDLLVTNSLVRIDPSFRTRSTLCHYQVFHRLCLCCCSCFCPCHCYRFCCCSCLCSCSCHCLLLLPM